MAMLKEKIGSDHMHLKEFDTIIDDGR